MPRNPSRKFLAHGAGNGHGYRTQPQREYPQAKDETDKIDKIRDATELCDEPEAIGPAIVDAYGDLARTYDRLRYEADLERKRQARELLDSERRLSEIQRQAKMRHIDVSGEVHAVKQMLERAKKGGRTQPPAAVARIERIEARLDHRPDLAA